MADINLSIAYSFKLSLLHFSQVWYSSNWYALGCQLPGRHGTMVFLMFACDISAVTALMIFV